MAGDPGSPAEEVLLLSQMATQVSARLRAAREDTEKGLEAGVPGATGGASPCGTEQRDRIRETGTTACTPVLETPELQGGSACLCGWRSPLA